MNKEILWIRRDLRLSDNQALAAALYQEEVVIPVFILDPTLLASQYSSQQRWLVVDSWHWQRCSALFQDIQSGAAGEKI